MHLLIADDDADLARLVSYSARVLWPDCTISVAHDGATALRLAAAEAPDLVILDVMMPPPDGLEVCRDIRAADPRVPILMLSARDTVLDEVRALDMGADAYLTKPFDQLKLVARLRALARRAGLPMGAAGNDAAAPERGGLTIDLPARLVRLGGRVVDLTPTEWMLLEVLARRDGRVVPHRELVERVWGDRGGLGDLKTYISRLRHKLGDDGRGPRLIETHQKRGYRLVIH